MAAARIFAVVPAAGRGTRFGADTPKQYVQIAGVPVLSHTLDLLLSIPALSSLYLVVAGDDQQWRSCQPANDSRVHIVSGGDTRARSVANGLAALAGTASAEDWVLVHDVARPCCPLTDILRLIDELADDAVGGLLALPVSDTVKQADSERRVAATLDRDRIWLAQTPQLFRYGVLRQALARSPDVTDEAAAIEAAGLAPRLIAGSVRNLKITRAEDLSLAAFYLQQDQPS
ncbi:MAG TPA: 2-C-methyl-D-erythritol 4-phosphate cytidylyltransferase [Spongiibacteraceae bacterium]|jgi:2-C-methyl-D-erythritol 4-phosphate cytidylyltransferase|nr:2-C-methyl-D-erythritol 4-phosphate cytidylyltransferase [Spongiibacteraceae bacterium]HUH36348.1 2-C-methyl-D-erythritol 4-phosphate cytidylyltransferase [Spongiibacteraceae bacterium]